MASLKGQHRKTLITVLFLSSFLILRFYFHHNGNPQEGKPKGPSQLHARRSVPDEWDTAADPFSVGHVSNASISHLGFARAVTDDPYTCGPGRPCSNGACCGASGNCGYAPAYCGTGCISNCNARAPCGQYAPNPGQTCPLNACCSEFGFCGTTRDFCQTGCQSNCVLEPQPPGGSPKNSSLNRVVGYYETWSYRSKCNRKSPSDLPLSELTHLNYAFAFVDPKTYELTTMDKQTTEDLWQLTVDTKMYNPNLKVYVAVGGWTFSDNDTVTQPLLGNIASLCS